MSLDDVDKVSMGGARMQEQRKVIARGEFELRREMAELDIFGAEMKPVVVKSRLSDCNAEDNQLLPSSVDKDQASEPASTRPPGPLFSAIIVASASK